MYANYVDSPEQYRILRQLKNMFSTTPHWKLLEVCKATNWHLGSSIDHLVNVIEDTSSAENSVRQQPQSSEENKNDFEKNNFSKDEERIGSLIKKGYRVLVLMRGPPGVGKSYLARSIVSNFVDLQASNYSLADFVCSSDDYFYSAKGVYKYNSALLSEAHEFNHRKVRDKAKSGLSPIFVDNTNMQLWEMLPYIKFAVQNNYLIEILEPKTPWRNSSSILAEKNNHGVPRNRIQQIMEKYEKCSVGSLIRMLKNTKYTKTLPQMRSLPPLNTAPRKNDIIETDNNNSPKDEIFEKEQHHVWNDVSTTPCKGQRIKLKSNRSQAKSHEQKDSPASSSPNACSILEDNPKTVWLPFESESIDFWKTNPSKSTVQHFSQPKDPCKSKCNEKSLLDLLREDSSDAKNELKTVQGDEIDKIKDPSFFKRHSINCPNENAVFASLRQVYPNKRVSDLWDLFVKCNGDVDWAIDILLKEDDMERIRGNYSIVNQLNDDDLYECPCDDINKEAMISHNKKNFENDSDIKTTAKETYTEILSSADAKPQRQRPRFSRSNQRRNAALLEIKENIENCFVLGDDHYSDHLLKIRNIRSGPSDANRLSNVGSENYENIQNVIEDTFTENKKVDKNEETEDVERDNEAEDFNEDMLEMSLGEQLVQQLMDTFCNEFSLEGQISSTLPINVKVFMPRSLAKQLYMLWVESAFNYMEEERQNLVKEDEDFARLLKNPKYSEYMQSPSNLHEILDMEYAWNIYNENKVEQQQRDIDIEKNHIPKNLATHLTHMKLCETFPDIPRETLLDILASNANDYNTTVGVLRSTMKIDDVTTTQEHLMECVQREQDLVSKQVKGQTDHRQKRVTNNWDEDEQKSTLSPDEAKRLALREFEESRNLAAHHCQLKAECYQKAKEAIQSGNGGAGFYYSQIANLHIKKIDIYNHRAANCIMEVHKNTQNNPDLLDLHYLYLIEALECLDLFLDRHITGLRVASRNYKHVFIITGRGKHSAGGVSTIKNKVKSRLKERCLRWSEVNPGLLKVKIFSGSRHSKNI